MEEKTGFADSGIREERVKIANDHSFEDERNASSVTSRRVETDFSSILNKRTNVSHMNEGGFSSFNMWGVKSQLGKVNPDKYGSDNGVNDVESSIDEVKEQKRREKYENDRLKKIAQEMPPPNTFDDLIKTALTIANRKEAIRKIAWLFLVNFIYSLVLMCVILIVVYVLLAALYNVKISTFLSPENSLSFQDSLLKLDSEVVSIHSSKATPFQLIDSHDTAMNIEYKATGAAVDQKILFLDGNSDEKSSVLSSSNNDMYIATRNNMYLDPSGGHVVIASNITTTLSVNSDAYDSGAVLYVNGSTVLGTSSNDGAAVSGDMSIGGDTSIGGGATINGTLIASVIDVSNATLYFNERDYPGNRINNISVGDLIVENVYFESMFLDVTGTTTFTGLVSASSGLSVTSGGLSVTRGITINNDGLWVSGGLTMYNSGEIHGGLSIIDGGLTVSSGGVIANAGLYVINTGIRVTHGITINTDGLNVATGGLQATGGATIHSGGIWMKGGLTVFDTGFRVNAGGATINTGGLTVSGGLTISSQSFTMTGSATIGSSMTVGNGLTVTNGLVVDTKGIRVTTGGITVGLDGLIVTGGVTVQDTGIYVGLGGATINSGGIVVNADGVTVNLGGTTINADGLAITAGGCTISQDGIRITSGGLSVVNDGIVVNGGLSVTTTGLFVNDGLSILDTGITVQTGGIVVQSGGIQVSQGISVFSNGIRVTGGLTVYNGDLTVTSGNVRLTNGNLEVVTGTTTLAGLTVSNDGISIIGGGMTINQDGLSVNGAVSMGSGCSVTSGLITDTLDVTGTSSFTGQATFSGGTVGTSDARLKTNIKPISDALSKILLLNGVHYSWKAGTKNGYEALDASNNRHIGFLAQEVQRIVPEIVVPLYPEGKDDQRYLGIRYDEIIPIIVEGMKEFNAKLLKQQKSTEGCDNVTLKVLELEETVRMLASELHELKTQYKEVLSLVQK